MPSEVGGALMVRRILLRIRMIEGDRRRSKLDRRDLKKLLFWESRYLIAGL